MIVRHTMLEIALFGEPRFTIDGQPHAFVAPPKALPMLAFLLLQRNSPTAREALAGTFWPDCDEETARANLRRHLHYIRKALPAGEWLRVDSKTVQWNADAAFRLDIADFEQQSNVAQMRHLAVKLYRGDLYPTCEEEWLYFERERLRNMQIGNLASLAQDAERTLNHVTAAEYARELLKIEPWREDAVRIVMRARMQTGDRGGALEEYERFRARLADEVGVEPMPETRELFEAFARMHDRAPSSTSRAHDIVGRAGELEALLVGWRAAMNGRGGFALVGGEAGVGKSALLREFAGEARKAGGTVLTSEVSSQADAPYAAFSRALAQAQLDKKLHPAATASSERGAFFASVAAALQALAERSPVLLCIEDLHWAGGDTIALLEFLERRLRDARVLIACSYREDGIASDHPLRTLRRLLSARPTFTHVALNPLTFADARHLARRRLGDRVDEETIETLYRRSRGNAFFLTELLEDAVSGEASDVPDSIRDLVEERYDALSPGARETISNFAVAGPTISPELLKVLAEGDAGISQRTLDELVQARFLREDRGISGTSYAFSHDVVRESLYVGIDAERRAALHVSIARAWEQISVLRHAAAIASHYERAGKMHDAARSYVLAAQQAADAFANEDAQRFARAALSLHDDADLTMEAHRILDRIYHRSAKRELQLRNVIEMEAVAERSGNQLHACEAIYRRLIMAVYENDADALGIQLDRLRARVPDTPQWKGRLETYGGIYDALCGNPDSAWTRLQTAVTLFREAEKPYAQLYCYERLLQISDGYKRPFEPLLSEARALAQRLDDPDSAFLLAYAEAQLFLHVDRTQCQHSALRIIEAGEQTGDQIYIGVGHMYLGAVATYRFEPADAEYHFAIAHAALQDSARRTDIARLFRFRGLYYFNIGDVERGLEDSLTALAIAREAREHDLIAVAAGNAVYGYFQLGRHVKALRLAVEVWEELKRVRRYYPGVHHLMLSLGFVLSAQGLFDEGIKLMKRARDEHALRGQKLHAAWGGTSIAYEMLRAKRADEARQYIESYLNILPDMVDEGWMPQLTLWQTAQVLRALQDRDRAQSLLARAAQIVADRLAALPSEEQQQRFIEFPTNREILRAHSENVWPTL